MGFEIKIRKNQGIKQTKILNFFTQLIVKDNLSNITMKKAIIIGATGLVGRELVKLAVEDPYFSKVKIFVRRPAGFHHPKLQEEIIDFDAPDIWKDKVKGDVLFSALGTTLKKAGSKDTQRRIDYDYQYQFARIASENAVPEYVLVSAPGASPNSMIFYSRIKGELDREVEKLAFRQITLIKPSILVGERDEIRKGEEIGIKVMNVFKKVPGLKKYRPVHGSTVARSMINAVKLNKDQRLQEYKLDELFDLAEENEK